MKNDVPMSREYDDPSNPFWEPEKSLSDNPFDSSESLAPADESIDSLLVDGNQTPVPFDPSAVAPVDAEDKSPTWDQIASFLLRKSLHLTALEFHAELHERGVQLPRWVVVRLIDWLTFSILRIVLFLLFAN